MEFGEGLKYEINNFHKLNIEADQIRQDKIGCLQRVVLSLIEKTLNLKLTDDQEGRILEKLLFCDDLYDILNQIQPYKVHDLRDRIMDMTLCFLFDSNFKNDSIVKQKLKETTREEVEKKINELFDSTDAFN